MLDTINSIEMLLVVQYVIHIDSNKNILIRILEGLVNSLI